MDARPLALNVDIDAIRLRLGRWAEHDDDAKREARRLGFELAESHLAAGYDVVLPQLLANEDVIDRVAAIAAVAGADFREVILMASLDTCCVRSEADRSRGGPHPRSQFDSAELARRIEYSHAELSALAQRRPTALVVDVTDDVTETAMLVEAALAGSPHGGN